MSSILGCFLIAAAAVSGTATIDVNSIADLQAAIDSASPGDHIVVANGVYATSGSITISRAGTAELPIVIEAQTIGGVEITGSRGFALNSPAAHVHIQGFYFSHASGGNAVNSGATFCRFTRNIFECSGNGAYLVVAGDDAQIDRNEFRNKKTIGNMIDVRGAGSQIARRVWIHHNYFHDFANAGGNGAETIRFGLSGLSMSDGNGLIEYNLFVRCTGENEMISNKSCSNTYRYNTLLDSRGAELTLRHGNNCIIYGNYFRRTDGMRIFGDRHVVFSNYFESNTDGIEIGNGDGEVAEGAKLTCHDRPDGCLLAFNTLINNSTHFKMAGRNRGLGATNTTFANNILHGPATAVSISSSAPYADPVWEGNIIWDAGDIGNIPAPGYSIQNPLLAADADGVFHLQAGSPAIDSALGAYPQVTVDMDGQPRSEARDKGADEISDAPVIAQILDANDVGPFAAVQPVQPATGAN